MIPNEEKDQKENNFTTHENCMKFQFQCLFIGSELHSFICILSVAALRLKWKTSAWPVKSKRLTLWPFTERVANLCLKSGIFYARDGMTPKEIFLLV